MPSLVFKSGSQGGYSLCAVPSQSGFFGLSNLQNFAENLVGPFLHARSEQPLVFDFSQVKVWDIAALLWLTVGLHHYKRSGVRFLLRLPDPRLAPNSEKQVYQRSADYLRRWNFSLALQNVSGDVDDLLVPEQRGYFAQRNQTYFEARITTDLGVEETLISRQLVGIRNLVDLSSSAAPGISRRLIAKCITDFHSARIGDILNFQCRIPKRDADLFSDHLLTEGLMNVLEHPHAMVGMISISVMGITNELILAIADNGDSIQSTIAEVYASHNNMSPDFYKKDDTSAEVRARMIQFATQAKITRKSDSKEFDAGMGLTYIKEDVVKTFGGRLRIIADSVQIEFKDRQVDAGSHVEWRHPWKGNLLRLSIPLNRPRIND